MKEKTITIQEQRSRQLRDLAIGDIKTVQAQIRWAQMKMRQIENDLGEGHKAEDEFADIFHGLRGLRQDLNAALNELS